MRLDDVMHVLKAIALFKRVEPEALRVLAFSAIRRPLRAGDILFRRGERSDGGYLVVEGAIVMDQRDDGAPSSHIYGPGTLIGQAALFTALERPATAIAKDTSAVLVFSRDLMMKIFDAYPQSAQAMRDALADETRAMAASLGRIEAMI